GWFDQASAPRGAAARGRSARVAANDRSDGSKNDRERTDLRPDDRTIFFRRIDDPTQKARNAELKADRAERRSQLSDLFGVGHGVALEPVADAERRNKLPDFLPLPFGIVATSGLNQGGGEKEPDFQAFGVTGNRLSQVEQCGLEIAEEEIGAPQDQKIQM